MEKNSKYRKIIDYCNKDIVLINRLDIHRSSWWQKSDKPPKRAVPVNYQNIH